ncbi:hypothetical protein JX265_005866 [Neoarthrinium moseri]|uniref:Xylanolytic transcriptional activator regulatory domain-containing protein n=1 Tax=Neoarthrinium moseri TaxID=1658444 RepID=A0A9P9WNC4_9PEZI|nr:hypothetical protein JX266_005850 [Neoarthrinium moseri]KAI1871880.1 hypothetical protein JX265_005866 [Neoarthrinium moseri]
MSPDSASKLAEMGVDYNTIMSRMVNTASSLVTSDDDLVCSLEGIECIMIESMYLNNAGYLRRAWLTNRKAMSLAQVLGLHTGSNSPSMALSVETSQHIDPAYMWFRIVVSDRYLSLMLGLPQGTSENIFASPKALEGCTPLERMERMESVAAGLILQRNKTALNDIETVHKIDATLQEAAALMPPQWWLMTFQLTAAAGQDAKAFEDSIRLTNQFAHFHLLVQLHLPYMLRSSPADKTYNYSKITATSASRAIVERFVSFRESVTASAYCRGIDFVTFVASTTLCIAHIEARRQREAGRAGRAAGFQAIQHQRLSDRGLLERTLEIMEGTAETGRDAVAQKISSILRPLLFIEINSARGTTYHTSASHESGVSDSQGPGGTCDGSNLLRIQIPYFGTIKIEYRPNVWDNFGPAQTYSEESHREVSISHTNDCNLLSPDDPMHPHGTGQQDKRSGQTSSVNGPIGYEISATQPLNSDWQVVPLQLDSQNLDESVFAINEGQETHLLVPGLTADVDDWALQGVDMALFSSLTQGSTESADHLT